MTDWNPPRTVSHREATLSFAVRLVDAFTGDRPEEVTLSVDPVDAEPVTNQSGYHVFLDLTAEELTLTVDGGDAYVDERRHVVLGPDAGEGADADGGAEGSPDGAPTHVVTDVSEPLAIELTPTPAYAFPTSATLVRGHVRTGEGDPVAGATVTLREFDPVVETTDTGEFAVWAPVSAEHVVRRDDRRVVVVDGVGGNSNGAALADGDGTDPTLVVDHPDHGETTEALEVAAGTRTVHHVTLDG